MAFNKNLPEQTPADIAAINERARPFEKKLGKDRRKVENILQCREKDDASLECICDDLLKGWNDGKH